MDRNDIALVVRVGVEEYYRAEQRDGTTYLALESIWWR